MNVIYDDKIETNTTSYGIGLGNFDGIHLGHKKLIKTLVTKCDKKNLESMIYTFTKHPANILKNKKIKLISTLERKTEILDEMDIKTLCLKDFDSDFQKIDPESFVKNILVEKYKMKLLVVGFNYRFGYKGQGDINLLKKLAIKYDFELIEIEAQLINNEIISSTSIRAYIDKGEMETVKSILGRYYSIKGKVEYGNKIGREIGFPTANIVPIKDYAIPKYGVYLTKTSIDNIIYNSITNLGIKPTIDNSKRLIIETHIFDFSGWLYGKDIEVEFIEFVRAESKFTNIDELKIQIKNDIKKVKGLIDDRKYI